MAAAGLLAGPARGQETGRVVRVVDGDTYDVLTGGQRVRVRLRGVDAPEHGQAFGPQATDSVARLLGSAPRVWLARRGVDLYGRTLATVRLPVAGGPALALDSLLVMRGWAWAYDPQRRVARRAAQQAAAVAGGRGLWKCGTGSALRRYGVGCTW